MPAEQLSPAEVVMRYARDAHGYRDSLDAAMQRACAQLQAAGKIERRERTANLPAIDMPERIKRVAMFDTWSPRAVTIVTWHAVGA